MAKATGSKEVTFDLPHSRETKGTHLYQADIDGRAISFYVPKDKIPEGVKADSTLKLVLTWA